MECEYGISGTVNMEAISELPSARTTFSTTHSTSSSTVSSTVAFYGTTGLTTKTGTRRSMLGTVGQSLIVTTIIAVNWAVYEFWPDGSE